ncbi:COG3904 family protein [Parasedimentitalea psychrophila]|uniref:Uncharacterized protein n=1 Tax=Parasedimentitalea psychrophila TaxID=2997337 RepID=A0A9Y2L2E0_9RHOB|nr:hypothetical protein [Parasedimentitalea psychrophila]WIY27446.1 hypothetical protein QPJ95_11335 [Parasedimentitalea psychrophila]
MFRFVLVGIFCVMALPLAAKGPKSEKFSLEGQVLIYDTETQGLGKEAEMTVDDIEALKDMLHKHPDVTELRLNSSGGSVFAGEEMAWIVIDFGLNTTVSGQCVSACVDLFLAGSRRRMTLGSKMGFHQRRWAPRSVKNYYESWNDDEGWKTPFDFGSWIYEDTQTEIYQHLSYLVDRGVDAGFAIETLRVDSDGEWYPSRLKLIAAGVLREDPVAH